MSNTTTMNIFTPPPETEYNVLSLGAGVQSSALALMAAHGEITPTPDFAVFADTQAEPTEVYEWLETLRSLINAAPHPFPIYTVTRGNLTEDSLTPTTKKTDNGKGIAVGETYVKKLIPLFGVLSNGKKTAAIGRKCTSDYKIVPVHNEIKKRCGVVRGQKAVTVTQWIGISWDEIQRAKECRAKWGVHRWPLLERKITRADCHEWMAKHGYPDPPRSACYYCPFHSDTEWRRLRDDDPEHFQKALDFDKSIREAYIQHDKSTRMEVYLHSSCKPLGEVDFDNDEDRGQQTWDFQSECEGMCGV